jgi:aryl-alcohol dehydrogenase-like predicted oxidoreductase
MLDFNLLQQDRLAVMKKFSTIGIKVWAGTALCQGFLIQSLVQLILRTRSLSYLARAFLQPETRLLLTKSKNLRAYLKNNYPALARSIPIQYVMQCKYVDFLPIGMLSTSSITTNVKALTHSIPQSVISDVEDWALFHAQLNRPNIPS